MPEHFWVKLMAENIELDKSNNNNTGRNGTRGAHRKRVNIAASKLNEEGVRVLKALGTGPKSTNELRKAMRVGKHETVDDNFISSRILRRMSIPNGSSPNLITKKQNFQKDKIYEATGHGKAVLARWEIGSMDSDVHLGLLYIKNETKRMKKISHGKSSTKSVNQSAPIVLDKSVETYSKLLVLLKNPMTPEEASQALTGKQRPTNTEYYIVSEMIHNLEKNVVQKSDIGLIDMPEEEKSKILGETLVDSWHAIGNLIKTAKRTPAGEIALNRKDLLVLYLIRLGGQNVRIGDASEELQNKILKKEH